MRLLVLELNRRKALSIFIGGFSWNLCLTRWFGTCALGIHWCWKDRDFRACHLFDEERKWNIVEDHEATVPLEDCERQKEYKSTNREALLQSNLQEAELLKKNSIAAARTRLFRQLYVLVLWFLNDWCCDCVKEWRERSDLQEDTDIWSNVAGKSLKGWCVHVVSQSYSLWGNRYQSGV